MGNTGFLFQELEFLYPLPYEPIHVFHVSFSTCFKFGRIYR